MGEHTPGPWEQVPQHGAGPMIAHPFDTGKQMNPTGLRLVCHILQRGNSLDQDKANARLIAAAPDLLEALEAFAEWFGPLEDNHMLGDECRNCFRLARRALSAASGRAPTNKEE